MDNESSILYKMALAEEKKENYSSARNFIFSAYSLIFDEFMKRKKEFSRLNISAKKHFDSMDYENVLNLEKNLQDLHRECSKLSQTLESLGEVHFRLSLLCQGFPEVNH